MAELILGFDFGTTKIGIAVGQAVTSSASPLTTVGAKDGKPDWQVMDSIIKEWQPNLFVVGLPLNMDGSASDMSKAATKFARRLQGRYNLPYVMMDERLTTFEARRQDASDIDSAAASLILSSYLNQQKA